MNQVSVYSLLALVTAGFLWPSEAAMEGRGLHLAALWLMLAALHPLLESRFNTAARFSCRGRCRLLTIGMLLLIAGFWLSTWHVFHVRGDRRTALNLAFEWSAVLAAWWLLRHFTSTTIGCGRLASVLTGIAVGLSVLGVWQHHWLYQHQAEWYRGMTDALNQATDEPGLVGQMEAASIRAELQQNGVPLSGTSRELFERRLLSSSEPYGTFALANTLAGVLAASLVILVGSVTTQVRRRSLLHPRTAVLQVIAAVLIGYCLLLTKSRTAWVGSVVGTLAVLLSGNIGRSRRRAWLAISGVGAVLAAGAGIGLATGAIDREVALEAPRSLQFRLFYWTGAAGVIRDSPVFGAGPGNFRQRYLAHKPVESSEEILDPHNILLDTWSTAGIAGLAGLLLMMWMGLAPLWRDSPEPDDSPRQSRREQGGGLVTAAIVSGWGLHWLVQLIDGMSWDDTQTVVLAIPVCALGMAVLAGRRFPCPPSVAAAALLAVFVHLLGAGGLQISVVGLLLAILLSLAVPPAVVTNPAVGTSKASVLLPAGRSLGFGGLALAVIVAGIVPVRTATSLMLRGDAAMGNRDSGTAEAAWRRAADADPLAVDPRQRLAEAATYRLMAESANRLPDPAHGSPEDLTENDAASTEHEPRASSLAACDALIDCDVWRVAGYHYRAQQHQILALNSDNPTHLRHAIDDQRRVLDAYPSNGTYWMELANMFQADDQSEEASKAAARALAIDDINRTWGHVDRYLASHEREYLELLVNGDSHPGTTRPDR
ncbi:MAG: O-antigen ligase family protein [Planctomycetaceae bacterium]